MEWDNVVFFRVSFVSLNGVSIGSCLQAVKKAAQDLPFLC